MDRSHHGHEIDIYVSSPAPLALLKERARGHAARVVDENIEPTEFGICLGNSLTQRFTVHGIARNGQAASSELGDTSGRLIRTFRYDIEHDNIGPGCSKREGNGPPDPAATTGDERHLPIEPAAISHRAQPR
ncbi:hypothetical protein GCM10009076_15830 [Erythrobacter ramosus]